MVQVDPIKLLWSKFTHSYLQTGPFCKRKPNFIFNGNSQAYKKSE
jgi:hypothetical protein